MKTLFVVDDNHTNLEVAQRELSHTYKVLTIPSAAKMFKMLERITPDIILLDIEMPEMDGFEACRLLKANAKTKGIPVIFLTAKSDAETETKGFELGVVDFISKPFSAPVLLKRLESHLDMDELVKKRTREVVSLRDGLISAIADMVESRDAVTGSHIERTQVYLEILVKALIENKGAYADELGKWDMAVAVPSAQLHDIGKLNIPDSVLNKPGNLTDAEFDIIKGHTIEGEKLIQKIINRLGDDTFLIHAKKFAGSHHEKWNGTGYPKGLSGEDIPLEGRIMAIADVYDALVSERPYKKSFTHDEAVAIIEKDAGTHFDPAIVEVFKTVADDFWITLEMRAIL